MTNENELRDYLELVAADLRRTRRCLRGVEEKHAGPVAIVGMGERGLGPALTTWRRGDRGGPATADWRYRVTWLSADARASALPGTWLLVAPERQWLRNAASQCAGAMAGRGARVDTMLVDSGTVSRDVLAGLLEGALDGEPLTGVVSLLGLAETPATLALIQALADAGLTVPLWLLAPGSRAAAGEHTNPEHAEGLEHTGGLERPGRRNGVGSPPGEFGARAAALLCSVLAGSEAGQAANRPVSAQSGRPGHAMWPAEAHREFFEASTAQ